MAPWAKFGLRVGATKRTIEGTGDKFRWELP